MENKEQKKQERIFREKNKYIPPKIKGLIVLETTFLLNCIMTDVGACSLPPFANS